LKRNPCIVVETEVMPSERQRYSERRCYKQWVKSVYIN